MTRDRVRTPPTPPVVQARVRARAVKEEIAAVAPAPRERVRVAPNHVAATTGRTRSAAPNGANPPRTRTAPTVRERMNSNEPLSDGEGYVPPPTPGMPSWWSPGMPTQWPNGSAYMTGPEMPGYKAHTRHPGEPEEANPNLRGRWVRIDDRYHAFRWLPKLKRYKHAGEFLTTGSAFAALRPGG